MIEDILTQLGTTAVVIAIAAFIAKAWLAHQLDRMSARNSHELAKQIAKLRVHEPHLHKRRVEVIEAMYSKILDAEFSLQNFLLAWWGHSNKKELISKGLPESYEFSNQRGLEFCETFTEINAMLHKNALYFDDQFIEDIRQAYKPFVDLILNMDILNPPVFPEDYKDLVSTGQAPRQSVIALFRGALGVEN